VADVFGIPVDGNTFAMALVVYLLVRFEQALLKQTEILNKLEMSIEELSRYIYLKLGGNNGKKKD
jgi:hypothetical protein